MNTFPNDLGGSHPLAAWGNKLLRASRAGVISPGPGYRLQQTSAGTVLQIDAVATGETYPFRIVPTGTSWLTFKVTTGYVITTGAAIEPDDVDTEFTLTGEEAAYWFYLDLNDPPTVLTSATVPAWGVDIVPIGWVDTNTYFSTTKAVIHQFIRDHVFSPCVTA